jgi:hypothetical protein
MMEVEFVIIFHISVAVALGWASNKFCSPVIDLSWLLLICPIIYPSRFQNIVFQHIPVTKTKNESIIQIQGAAS